MAGLVLALSLSLALPLSFCLKLGLSFALFLVLILTGIEWEKRGVLGRVSGSHGSISWLRPIQRDPIHLSRGPWPHRRLHIRQSRLQYSEQAVATGIETLWKLKALSETAVILIQRNESPDRTPFGPFDTKNRNSRASDFSRRRTVCGRDKRATSYALGLVQGTKLMKKPPPGRRCFI